MFGQVEAKWSARTPTNQDMSPLELNDTFPILAS